MGKTLFQKVWDRHAVGPLPDGSTQLFIGTHLIQDLTFLLREHRRKFQLTFADATLWTKLP